MGRHATVNCITFLFFVVAFFALTIKLKQLMIEILWEILDQILVILGENFKPLNFLRQFSLPLLKLVFLLLQSLTHFVVFLVLLLVLGFLFRRLF